MIICHCERCGYEWASRKLSKPDRCARCRAWYWWRPKRIKKIKPPPGPVGRPVKYPVHVLNVGQELLLEWPKNIYSMKQSIKGYARRTGRAFDFRDTVAGLVVRRIL